MTPSRLSERLESDYVRVDILRLGRALSAVSSAARLLNRHHRIACDPQKHYGLTSSRPTRATSGEVVFGDRGSGCGYSAAILSGRNHPADQPATGLVRACSTGRLLFSTIAQGFQQRVDRLSSHSGSLRYLGL